MNRPFGNTRHTLAVVILVAAVASGCASSRPPQPKPSSLPTQTVNIAGVEKQDEPAVIPEEIDDSIPAPRWDIFDWTWDVEYGIREEVSEWFGTPYRMGGNDKSGVDCSAFVLAIYRDLFGTQIPRTTTSQVKAGEEIPVEELQPGDLVFFRPGRSRHVGIYLRDGEFAHASQSQGVMISRLDEAYWDRAFWTARRLLDVSSAVAGMPSWNVEEMYVPEDSAPILELPVEGEVDYERSGW